MLESSLEVTVGDGVSFRFTVANGGDTPVELTFRDACKADFAVYEDGTAVWRYSDDRAFAQMLTTAELQPGETATFEEVWPAPTPGDYTAEATLRVVERDISARTPFSV
jgi:subtilase family serine protease